MDNLSHESLMEQRQRKIIEFVKKNINFIIYGLLAIVIYISVFVRTRNLAGLRDVTTGGWTLGPDLDPFLFLRWAKYIVENGQLYQIDPLRYVPLGFNTGNEFPLLAKLIAFFHNNLANLFGSNSIEQSAAIFPVFMFALTVVAFFLMTREAFFEIAGKKNANYIAIIASLFLSIIPSFVPRTIAGIPEKESVAFFFFFMAFYFFLLGCRQDTKNKSYLFSALGGVFAGLMGLTWGGFAYILLIFNGMILISFLLGQINIRKTLNYFIFIIIAEIIPFTFFPIRFDLLIHFSSIEGMFTALTSMILISDFFIYRSQRFEKYIPKIIRPYRKITSMMFAGLIILVAGLLIFGPGFLIGQIKNLYFQLVQPATSRLIQTVAENRQPFFVEWAGNFGPNFAKIPVLLPIVFIGSLLILYQWLKVSNISKRYKTLILSAWTLFVFTTSLTRYSPESIFNGSSFFSVTFYFLGVLFLVASFFYVNKKEGNKGNKNIFSIIPMGAVFIAAFFIIGLISARAFIRLVIILVPIASMLVGYVFVISCSKIYEDLKERKINMIGVLSLLIIAMTIFAAYGNYSSSKSLASNYIPSAYTQQWQKAMSWVRDNTPTNAVFGHWWDYGYWIQTIGERATVLDGGNFIGYWNYLMGRHGLTETNFSKTLEFLYSHNVTHFLIDSTDIGKYSAFSTIGSDPSYDRKSWIPTLLKDDSQTVERKNTTLSIYPAGFVLDKDITYNLNGTELFLPEGKSYLAAVIISTNKEDELISDVWGVYYLKDKSYQIPLRYYWNNEEGFVDRGKGIDAGVFIYPRLVVNSQGGGDIEARGAMLYLSSKTVKSNVARFYLYGEKNDNFKIKYEENDSLINLLNAQGVNSGEFVFFNEFRGPIKIWELNYPKDITFKEEYVQTEYPAELLYA